MPDRQGVVVVTLRAGDEDVAAEVLVASHADYPAFRAVFPNPDQRRRALAPFLGATVRDALGAGVVHGARLDGVLAGVAVWLPPGATPLPPARKLRMMPAMLAVLAAAPRSFPTFLGYGRNVERHHPRDRHWYLVVLGVGPDAQHRGVGTALVEAGLHLVDADGADCYLETSDGANVGFYERFGFSVVDPDLRLVPGGPSHVAMRRPSSRRQGRSRVADGS
ncbi:MAG: GNAT family N-acetyltransferase [Actinomycetota bacterium]|nr:GNAT family N-acetyltransferase [Actinomycetota bacterium]